MVVLVLYDALLITTSLSFGAGVCARRHPLWQYGVYAAFASVCFRLFRIVTDQAGAEMPTHPLYLHDCAAAITAMVLIFCGGTSSARVRAWVGRAFVLFAVAKWLQCQGYAWESRAVHTLGHVCIVLGAWCPALQSTQASGGTPSCLSGASTSV